MNIINMSVLYGLVKNVGPYARPYRQKWEGDHNYTVDPWNQIVETHMIEPSEYAEKRIVTRELPNQLYYRRYRPGIELSDTTQEDITALFGPSIPVKGFYPGYLDYLPDDMQNPGMIPNKPDQKNPDQKPPGPITGSNPNAPITGSNPNPGTVTGSDPNPNKPPPVTGSNPGRVIGSDPDPNRKRIIGSSPHGRVVGSVPRSIR